MNAQINSKPVIKTSIKASKDIIRNISNYGNSISREFPIYDKEYVIDSSLEDTELETSNKVMTSNITINKLPVNRVKDGDGYIIYIGSESD